MRERVECVACVCDLTDSPAALSGDWFGKRYLCCDCWAKVERGGRVPQQTIEAVLLYRIDKVLNGPDCLDDPEDSRDLELLGLWSGEVTEANSPDDQALGLG